MPEIQQWSTNAISLWVNGPEGSGKTRLALGFPDVFAVTFDPTGLDMLSDPENANLRGNLKWHVPMNGLLLQSVFQFTEQPGETGIYAAVALAKQLAAERKIKTFLLDGFTYLASLKWTQICEANGVDMTAKEAINRKSIDQRHWYDALGSYLDHLILQNVLPLSTRHGLHVIVTCHVQRESENTIKGVQDNRNPDLERQSKRLVNLDSDISPQVVGSFRQRIGGLPSAMIYLEHKLVEDKDGKEAIQYLAYCRMTRSTSLDTTVKAKNRFGLGTLDLTHKSFYNTLMRKISQQQQPQPAVDTKTKAAKGE